MQLQDLFSHYSMDLLVHHLTIQLHCYMYLLEKDTRNDELHREIALAVNKTLAITNMMVQNESAKIAIQGEQEKQGNTEDTENTENTATSAPTSFKAIKAKIIDLHGLENNSKGSGVLGWLGSWFTSKSKK